jgi:hypothetical protein
MDKKYLINLPQLCVGIAQQQRWAKLSRELPKPKLESDRVPYVQLTITKQMQDFIDLMELQNKYWKEYYQNCFNKLK